VYLLDTNHCSRIIASDAAILEHLRVHHDALLSTSVIVQGELFYMAQRSEHQLANRSRIEAFLLGIRIYPIDGETASHYGDLKAAIMHQYGPREKAKRRRTTLGQLGFDDNDLWIAATALRHGLTVVTADSDFGCMQQARPFPIERWSQPPRSDSPGEASPWPLVPVPFRVADAGRKRLCYSHRAI
jgi:tRNA(fMet)-specific endonuclease VapC